MRRPTEAPDPARATLGCARVRRKLGHAGDRHACGNNVRRRQRARPGRSRVHAFQAFLLPSPPVGGVWSRARTSQRRRSVHASHRLLEGDCLMRAKTLLLVAAGLMIAGRARAVTITRGPIIENPDALTTTMTIAWWTDTTGDSTVEYGPTPVLGFSQTVAQAGSCEIGSAGTCHIVGLSGLLAGTRYYYQLKVNGVTVQARRDPTSRPSRARPIRPTCSSRSSATGARPAAMSSPSPTSRTRPTPR
ncbi:MAG: hypothetical protein E6J75_05800 [Deltaproteobacteria bacterium]|nr:MAG: hypothetical protein E6J75_05800 [Deltaproteobacteria bacterium]